MSKTFTAARFGRKTLLAAGTAGIALILAAGEASAQSNEACGPQAGGVVTCQPGTDFSQGVRYEGPLGDLTLQLGESVIEPATGEPGIRILNEDGSVAIDGAGAAVWTRNAPAVTVFTEGAAGASITLGEVTTVSDDPALQSWGVGVRTIEGPIVIDVETVRTTGDNAPGIIAASDYGDINIRAGTVETNGAYSDGIMAGSGGNITINAGTVNTTGEYARGMFVETAIGAVQIVADTVTTNGFAADGIYVTGGGSVSINVDTIRGTGDYIWGATVLNEFYDDFGQLYSGHTDIGINTIDLTGANNIGVAVSSWTTVNVRVGDLTVNGDFSSGVSVTGLEQAMVTVDRAYFTGEGTGSIFVKSEGYAGAQVGSLYSERGSGITVDTLAGPAYISAGTVDVGGDFGYGVGAASTAGSAYIRVDDVTSRGFASAAISMFAYNGLAEVFAGNVKTYGDDSYGLKVFGRESVINVSGSISTEGDDAFGLLTSTTFGDAQVTAAGPVSTLGDRASAFLVTGRYGTAYTRAIGAVTTAGAESHGIHSVGETGQVDVTANAITTTGAGANGVHARTRYVEFYQGAPDNPGEVDWTGDIDVRASRVEVGGDDAIGVSARGIGDARLLLGDVLSRDSFAIEANMIGDVSIDLRGSAQSTLGSAITAQGRTIDLSIASGARVEGAVDGLILTAGGRCLLPPPSDGVSANPCPNPGDDYGYPENPALYQPIQFGGTATVANAGLITGGTGYAVRQTHGALNLRNTGRIVGSVMSAGDGDRFDNAGVWEIRKDSDFGAGSDLLINSGVIRFGEATAPAVVTLRGLERLENSGLIDLRNGAVGDSLTVAGDFFGAAGSTVALDIDLAGGRADRLVVGGAASGTTLLTLNGDYGQASLGAAEGVVVIQTGVGSSATAFALAAGEGDKGFVGHSLDWNAATRSYSLHTAASAAAYRQLGVLQALDGVWTSSAESWSAQTARSRDAAWAGAPTGGLWFSILGGESSRDWDAETSVGASATLSYRQDRYGAQFGYDRSINGELQVGVTGGYGQSTLEYRDSTDTVEVSTFNLGGYAGLVRGQAFANALVKYDRHQSDVSSTAVQGEAELDGSTWGADVEAGYRFGDADLFIEPIAGLRWTNTSTDDLVNGAQTLAFEDARDVNARIGVRIGGGRILSGGDRLGFYASASALHSFGDGYGLQLTSGQSQAVEGERVETWGQGAFGVSYRTARGLEVFAEGRGDLGQDYDAASASVGMRVRF